ncbi:alkaline phosphatase PhoX [Polynucleobacter sp.]|uniref:PhoX family protein n=1 Tax=Polynucleobacter sp. TaxID=2029855 RepID=UPI003341674A
MKNISVHQRRSFIKTIVGAPLLPIGGTGIAALFSSKSLLAAQVNSPFKSAEFIPMDAPSLMNPEAMATTTVGSLLEITSQNNLKKTYKLAYEPFFMTGDMVPDGNGGKVLAGGYVDIHNRPIMDTSVLGKERQFFSDCPDGMSLLKLTKSNVKGVSGNTVFAVVQFEYTNTNQGGEKMYAQLPSQIAVLTLNQNPKNGKLSLVKYSPVNSSNTQGLWITCGSSLSPWNTHLSSEEYEPDAPFAHENRRFKSFSKNLYGNETSANPYNYGYLPEVTVNANGTGTLVKHYCLGRISHELIEVMPDRRTVLMGDDYTNSAMFLFIADKAEDLSSGTLYVAKLGEGFSIDPKDAGAKLSWLKLGHATSDEIKKLAHSLKPSDIMTVLKADPNDPSFTKIFYDGVANWVKLNPGMEKAAAFLETHRYAYLMGGSMGFSKMEGTTANTKDKVAYFALQNIQDSMIRSGKGWNAQSNIEVAKPLIAGGIMTSKLEGNQKDQFSNALNSEWVPSSISALIVGEDIEPDALGNLANPNMISNPDNLKFSEKLRTLFIGEDSGTHVNNFIWAYNVDTKKLSRIASMPSGAEATGLGVVDDLNGWMYITANIQHPGDWLGKLHNTVKPTLDPLIKKNYNDRFSAAVGYITAIPMGIKMN